MASKLLALSRRQILSVRGFAADVGAEHQGRGTWKMMSFFVAIPAVLACYVNAQIKLKEEEAHLKEHGPPPFIEYQHLRLRSKPFPWGDGDHTPFHNPHVNAISTGYEH